MSACIGVHDVIEMRRTKAKEVSPALAFSCFQSTIRRGNRRIPGHESGNADQCVRHRPSMHVARLLEHAGLDRMFGS